MFPGMRAILLFQLEPESAVLPVAVGLRIFIESRPVIVDRVAFPPVVIFRIRAEAGNQDHGVGLVAQAYPALRLASEYVVNAAIRDHLADIKLLFEHIALRPAGIE